MGTISVDYSEIDPMPDPDSVRDGGQDVLDAVESVRDAVDEAKGDWGSTRDLVSSDSVDLEPFYTGFDRPSEDMADLVVTYRGFRDDCDTLGDAIEGLEERRDTLRNTTVPARQTRLDAAIGRLTEDSDESEDSLTETAQQEMQAIADAIAKDWDQAQQTFQNALMGFTVRVPRTYPNFEYGTNSATSAEGRDLFQDATSPGATPEQVKAWYDYLAELSPEELAALVFLVPAMQTSPPALPQDPESVNGWPGGDYGGEWWDSLTQDQRDALVAFIPATVGNTDGVPYGIRDQANRNTLDLVLNGGIEWASNQETYEQILDSLASAGPGSGDRFLVSFDPNGRPLAAVSVGDLDTADEVGVMVSGMTSGTHNMNGEANHAQNIYDGMEGDRAVVSWIGYDSPGYLSVFSDGDATEGAGALAQFLDGIHETRDRSGTPPAVSVLAHSYGTNVAATALTVTDHQVENAIFYGSAGLDESYVETAADLNVSSVDGQPQVYTTDAGEDPWSWVGRLGAWGGRLNPNDDDFGAIEFSSDGSGDVPGVPGSGHGQSEGDGGGYVQPGSQSYNSIIEILNGRGGDIVPMLDPQDGVIVAPGPPGYLDDPTYGGTYA